MRSNAFYQLTLSKLREILRSPEMVFWVFVFPLLLAGVLGLAFRSRGPEVLPVGIAHASAEATEDKQLDWIYAALDAHEQLSPRRLGTEEARKQLGRGDVLLVVVAEDPPVYWYDPVRPNSEMTRLIVDGALQRAAGRADPLPVATRRMTEKGSRYIDFLIPGLLGMNLMGTGMWGIGFFVVNAREKKTLKRFVATPMRKSDFLLAQAAGRLVFLVLEAGGLLAFAWWVLGVPLRGSLATLALVTILGASTFAGLGLLVASRARTVEGVSGLMNAAMMPMWVLSGIFFSTSRFPDAMQPLVQALPLTAANDALRSVMLDGASLVQVAGELSILTIWGVVSFAAALLLFRWT